jgi:hypothetical protein
MGQQQLSTALDLVWRFVRGDTPKDEFERSIYLNSSLEEALGAERYLELVSTNFEDPDQVDAVRSSLGDFALAVSKLECLCVTLADLAVVDMGEHEQVFAPLEERRRRGSPFWWLSLYVCRICSQGWLVAQEERHNDIFCMRRLDVPRVSRIVDGGVWPGEFDRYESLLRIGKDFGRAVRFVDPVGSSSLYATTADLARERPGITLSELCSLLNIDRAVAEKVARTVVANERLEISFDLPE